MKNELKDILEDSKQTLDDAKHLSQYARDWSNAWLSSLFQELNTSGFKKDQRKEEHPKVEELINFLSNNPLKS